MSSRSQLKQWFSRGKKPTAAQFADAFDSFIHKTDDLIQISDINQLTQALAGKAAIAHTHDTDDIQGLRDTVAEIMEDFLPETEEQPRAIVYVADLAALSDVQDPSTDALYITEDQGQLYKYRDGEFTLVEEEETVESGTFVVHGTFTQMDNRLKGVLTTCTKDCVLIQTGNAIATYRFVSVAQTKDGITKMQQTLVEEARNGVDGNTRTRTGTYTEGAGAATWGDWKMRTPLYKESSLNVNTTAKNVVGAINELAAKPAGVPTITMTGTLADVDTIGSHFTTQATDINDIGEYNLLCNYTSQNYGSGTLFVKLIVTKCVYQGFEITMQYAQLYGTFVHARIYGAMPRVGCRWKVGSGDWTAWIDPELVEHASYVSATPDELYLTAGETDDVVIDTDGGSWQCNSDDSSVATCVQYNGVLRVTAVGEGTATITVTSVNVSTTVTVHVAAAEEP